MNSPLPNAGAPVSAGRSQTVTRIISATVLVPVVLGILEYGSPWLVFVGVLVAGLAGWFEYAAMMQSTGIRVYRATGIGLTVLILFAFFQYGYRYVERPSLLAAVPIAAVAGLFTARLLSPAARRQGLDPLVYSLFGLAYVPGLLGFFLLLHDPVLNSKWIYFVFLVVWIGDTAAYFVGRAIGRRKLAPDISPGKTVEGAVGNVLGGLAGGAAAKLAFLPSLGWGHCLLAALICGIIGQLGDLFESFLKRSVGVKDSGSTIPGHGGVLDRIDSLLFAGPAFYCYWRFLM